MKWHRETKKKSVRKSHAEKLKLIAAKNTMMAAMLEQNITGKFALLPGEEKAVEEERNLRLAAKNAFEGTLHPTCIGAQAYQWADGMQWLIDTSGGRGGDECTHWLAKRWLHRLKTSRSLRQTVLGLPSCVAVEREGDEMMDELDSALNTRKSPRLRATTSGRRRMQRLQYNPRGGGVAGVCVEIED